MCFCPPPPRITERPAPHTCKYAINCWNAGGMTRSTNEISLVKFLSQQPVYNLELPNTNGLLHVPINTPVAQPVTETALDSAWLCYPVTKEGITAKC